MLPTAHRLLILAGLSLATILVAPQISRAQVIDHPYNGRYYDNRRYYDHEGRDYHVWNGQEDRAYRFYLQDQHLPYREWREVRRPGQADYFRWRHTHPDAVIVVR